VSTPYAWIGVSKTAEGTNLLTGAGAAAGRRGGAATPPVSTSVIGRAAPPAHLWLRVHCNFDTDQAVFSWSPDGRAFTPLGSPFTTTFQLTTFQGVRPALFNFNTSGQPGGYADFDNYTAEEPRARGIEREIPIGKTIVLTSGADGSVLAGDTRSNLLVSAAPDGTGGIAQHARFQVIDAGLGRVALKAGNGRFVSVDQERAILKALGKARPGVAESFQWVNLMRGDTMLMSLTNHRYLATTPDAPGAVTVTALGASAARKSGAEFKWTAVAR
jgi:hypothetical protein